MSGINAAIRVTDGMSPAMRSMNKALNIVLNSFERLQSVSGAAIDASDIRDARTELANAAIALNEVEDNARRAAEQQERFKNEVSKSESSMGSLVKKAIGLVGAYASFQTLMGAVNLSDQMSQTSSRIKLIAEVDKDASAEEIATATADLEKKIMASANRSRASYTETADAVVKLANNAGNAFTNNDEIIAFLEAVNKQFVIGGADASAMAGAMTQLTQGLAAGALRGDELNSVLEGAPGIARAIEKSMGWAEGSIKEYAEQGLVTAQVVKNAMLGSMDEINADFETMPMTWGQLMTVAGNYATQALNPVLAKISELANNPDIQNFAIGISSAIGTVATYAVSAFEMMAEAGAWVADNWSWIAPVLFTVVGALTAYYGIMLLVNAINAVSAGITAGLTLAKGLFAIATGGATAATVAGTAAQSGLNAAMWACPITWIIALVIGLIAVIVALISWILKATGVTDSAAEGIVGILSVAAAFIGNLFLGLLDTVLGIVNYWINLFTSFVNFFGNLFNDPIGAIINLFGDLADNVLGVLETIASAMDKVFGTDMASTVAGWRESLSQKVEIAAKEYGNGSYEDVMNEINLSTDALGLERWEYGKAWDSGVELGKGIDSALSEFSSDSFLSDIIGQGSDLADSVNQNLPAISGNTEDMANSLEMTDEDLQYLMDLSEQEAINRFTTAEIKIDMQNNNSIASTMDIDGIVAQLEDKLYESMEIAAEGSHL